MAGMRRRPSHRRDLRLVLLLAGLFAYVLCLTYERIEVKMRSGRIAGLERTLQETQSDEAQLRVTIERQCGFADVQKLARDKWGMEVARPGQRVLLAGNESLTGSPASPAPPSKANLIMLADHLGRIFREGVAQARPARIGEGGDGSSAR